MRTVLGDDAYFACVSPTYGIDWMHSSHSKNYKNIYMIRYNNNMLIKL